MLALPPPPSKQQIIRNQSSLESLENNRPNKKLWQPRSQRTKPVIWCFAGLCLIFSLLLIFFGIVILIFYLAIKPRNPTFDIPNASLNVVYYDSTQYLNGDFILLANFSNPNKRIDVKFESLDIELFFSNRLISNRTMNPFMQKPKETRLQTVNLISKLVFLPQDVGVKLQRQVESNKVSYYVRGTFKVKFNIGLIHLSYWLNSICEIEMTGPPAGVLVSRQCITSRR
ncbi:hypothetical protein HN51_049234 [Arachis hypogaea]|uniref:Uncharacterized protein n=2 Tax=Arachis TaxID=3817 RepID=A0A444YFN5_ARAHY|nr:uncharacterized protein At1g08160-like [Arachis duranensis]XP_016165547.1 uncharacterized protein At1g08160-like [Arachis ipaensis]XP_025608324.1 uncharacterized protein At1g08160 [Arachis hypogaea]XP_025666030.1 uncharacterized protein At1g08160 [Arachis hypogaea]XP_057726387.1 uncharacterized protein At1g08160-like [Arachis stenosperma]QHN90920.1 putative protein-like [Arachis hypogaea]RYR00728.1 hypothetical protein Ahy_B07g088853 [Arachis hypogaea]